MFLFFVFTNQRVLAIVSNEQSEKIINLKTQNTKRADLWFPSLIFFPPLSVARSSPFSLCLFHCDFVNCFDFHHIFHFILRAKSTFCCIYVENVFSFETKLHAINLRVEFSLALCWLKEIYLEGRRFQWEKEATSLPPPLDVSLLCKVSWGKKEKMAFRAHHHEVLIYDLIPQHFLL